MTYNGPLDLSWVQLSSVELSCVAINTHLGLSLLIKWTRLSTVTSAFSKRWNKSFTHRHSLQVWRRRNIQRRACSYTKYRLTRPAQAWRLKSLCQHRKECEVFLQEVLVGAERLGCMLRLQQSTLYRYINILVSILTLGLQFKTADAQLKR